MKKALCLGVALTVAVFARADTITLDPGDYYDDVFGVIADVPIEEYTAGDPIAGMEVTSDGLDIANDGELALQAVIVDANGGPIQPDTADTVTITWTMDVPTMAENDARYIELTGDSDGRGPDETRYFYLGFGIAGDYLNNPAEASAETKSYWGIEWDTTSQNKYQVMINDLGDWFDWGGLTDTRADIPASSLPTTVGIRQTWNGPIDSVLCEYKIGDGDWTALDGFSRATMVAMLIDTFGEPDVDSFGLDYRGQDPMIFICTIGYVGTIPPGSITIESDGVLPKLAPAGTPSLSVPFFKK